MRYRLRVLLTMLLHYSNMQMYNIVSPILIKTLERLPSGYSRTGSMTGKYSNNRGGTMRKAEPFKIKMVEPISLLPREEREKALVRAGYNVFSLKAEEIYIDLLTDSGTGAMSDRQWAGIMMGDETYAGSRSFYRLEQSAKDIFGYKYIVPAHQGRGAEQVLFQTLIKRAGRHRQYAFDTTMAHIELNGGKAVNLVHERAMTRRRRIPSKVIRTLKSWSAISMKRRREHSIHDHYSNL